MKFSAIIKSNEILQGKQFKKFETEEEARTFYSRSFFGDISIDSSGKISLTQGEKQHLEPGKKLTYYLPDYGTPINHKNERVNLAHGCSWINGLPEEFGKTYGEYFSRYISMCLLEHGEFREDNNIAEVSITMDPHKAKYICLQRYFYHVDRIPPLPGCVQQYTLFDAICDCRSPQCPTMYRIVILPFGYSPFERAPFDIPDAFLTTYRCALYDKYLEKYLI